MRIEDLDTARLVPGAEAGILATLEACGFEWDAEPLRQSTRIEAYHVALASLGRAQRLFACSCSRKTLEDGMGDGGAYPGTCRHGATRPGPAATRFRVDDGDYVFDDRFQGTVHGAWRSRGDVVVRRRDGVVAYQLAVVVDDAWQGITDVVRGADLLDSTPWQLAIGQALGYPLARYAHLPVLVEPDGRKLAKSRRTIPVDSRRAGAALAQALTLLGLAPPADLAGAAPSELWAWAIPRWSPAHLHGIRTLAAPE